MYRIVKKEALKPTVTLYEIEAPMVAKKAEPGQFIILRVDENGERIPITIHDYDREKGTVTIIVQTIGATTEKLRHKAEGEYIQDFVGPLGRPTETEGKKKVCVVGGGVGCAIAYPVLKKFHDCGAEVHAVVGFKNKDLVILEDKFRAASSVLKLMTDDGSYGEKGLVTDALKELIDAGNQYDEIFAIGPAIMMKFVSKTTEPYGIPTTVSMSPIMVDGTGMCGGCRLTVGARPSSPASTARTLMVTRSTGTRVSSAARCTSTGSVTNTKKPATCSARRFSKMPNMSLKKNAMPSQDPNVRNKNFLEVALGYTEEQALDEAARCLNCKNHPCVSGCPVQVKIPEFIQKITEKDYEGAYQVIHETSSLPAVCGRVCPQETQCESKCIRGIKGEPVGIGRLERFVADWHNANVQEAPAKPVSNGHKVAIIGSGPSGLTCAGDLAKKGYDVTVFEALHLAGGVLVYGIPEFRLPKAIVQKEIDNIRKLGVKIVTNAVVGRAMTVEELLEEGNEAVFVGSGAGLPNFQKIPGESLCGVYSANEFLTRINLMRPYTYPEHDTPVKVGQRLAVIGGGNVAMDAARCARRLGADVSIVYRRSEAEMPARKEEVHHAKEEGIHFRMLTNPKAILGDENGFVRAMTCVEMELGEPDERGRRRPVPKPGSEFDLPVETVVVAIGNSPNPLIKKTTPDLPTETWGGITTDEHGRTGKKHVYAGGDAVTGAATVIKAMGAGKAAAKAIDEYIQNK